jgi:Ca2+/Na+ antiporter
MSSPLTYLPAYLGLYAALVLGMVCNAFLDIQYGSFGFETLLWAGIFAYTLRVGWRQEGRLDDSGSMKQKIVLGIGAFFSVVVFIPMWGFPRAGLYILGVLQAGQNCVTVTRRNLHFGLLVSLIMVMFAATHARADWTMLFYLIPYIVAIVFTLVAEQINRRAQDVRREGLGLAGAGGQGAAIVAATAIILLFGGLLYAVTPQLSLTQLFWTHGQPGRIGHATGSIGEAQSGAGSGGAGETQNGNGDGEGPSGGGGLPTLEQMREAAKRPGMPQWQRSAITTIADVGEAISGVMRPINLGLDELWNDIKEWLKQHVAEIMRALWTLIVLALLVAAWLLWREARLGVWVRAHVDYVRFGILRWHDAGNEGARQYYQAMVHLFDLHGLERPPAANPREYLRLAGRRFDHLRREIAELTLIFERARYGQGVVALAELARMRELYLRMFRQAGQFHTVST